MKKLPFSFCKVLVASVVILLLIHCGEASSDSSDQRSHNGAPSNGVELIEIVVDKASMRFSLDEEKQNAFREILRETYIDKYGDPNDRIPPEEVREMKREIFIQSGDRIREHMNTNGQKD